MRWTQWPTSRSSSGSSRERRPLLIGVHVSPPSSVRKAPAAEIAMNDPVRVVGVDQDRVQAEPAGARLPVLAARVLAQARELVPGLAGVRGLEERRVLDPRVDGVRVVERRLEVPDARELPRVLGAVVPLVRPGNAVVRELVADGLPVLAAVVGALHHLAVPAGGLRRVQAIRVGRRALQVVHLPAREERALDVPVVARPVRGHDERSLTCPYEKPHLAHRSLPLSSVRSIQARATLLAPGEVSERSKERDWKSRTG